MTLCQVSVDPVEQIKTSICSATKHTIQNPTLNVNHFTTLKKTNQQLVQLLPASNSVNHLLILSELLMCLLHILQSYISPELDKLVISSFSMHVLVAEAVF
jgi:hypothetical protein